MCCNFFINKKTALLSKKNGLNPFTQVNDSNNSTPSNSFLQNNLQRGFRIPPVTFSKIQLFLGLFIFFNLINHFVDTNYKKSHTYPVFRHFSAFPEVCEKLKTVWSIVQTLKLVIIFFHFYFFLILFLF